MKTISVTEAARGFADLIDRVFYQHESALLTRGGKPVAKIVPVKNTAKTRAELAEAYKTWPRLFPEEAELFARDLEEARASLPPLVNNGICIRYVHSFF